MHNVNKNKLGLIIFEIYLLQSWEKKKKKKENIWHYNRFWTAGENSDKIQRIMLKR